MVFFALRLILLEGKCAYLITPVCSRVRLNNCQAESSRGHGVVRELSRSLSQMADPREEESVTLLGEEGLRAGGQALKLGFVQSLSDIYFNFVQFSVLGFFFFLLLNAFSNAFKGPETVKLIIIIIFIIINAGLLRSLVHLLNKLLEMSCLRQFRYMSN